MTRFDELVELNHADFIATYEYISKIILFANLAKQKIVEYLECNHTRVCFLDLENKPKLMPHGTAIIDEEGDFNFRIYIDIGQDSFNINECGKDFFEKGLVPINAVILSVRVKYQDPHFKTKIKCLKDGEVKDLEIIMKNEEDDESWSCFLDSCFQILRFVASRSLDDRIRYFVEEDDSLRPFGFQIDP